MLKNTNTNIVVIMCDDLGYGDLSCMGAEDFETPCIDSLAGQGVRLSSFYAASPVCSPSRAGLLTGRYPGHAGVRAILAGHRKATGLQPSIPSLPRILKDNGYQTGMSGKWHLGVAENCRPNQHGFDHFYGFLSGCVDYYSHIFYHGIVNKNMNPNHDLWRDGEEIYENGQYLTETITREAVDFIRKADKDRPFFLYTAYNAPHYPMHAPQRYMDMYRHLSPERQLMAAMIRAMDDGVGQIIQELKDQGIFENTLIYFQSDNGPSRESRNWTDGRMDPYYGGSAGGLRGYKYSLFEGGIRIPAILCCPSLFPAGQVYDEPCCAIDILPSICGMLGLEVPDGVDGQDIFPQICRGEPLAERPLFWEMEGQTAVRRGDYKLILHPVENEDRKPEYEAFLTNLRMDPSEQTNLVEDMPQLAGELMEQAYRFRAEIEKTWQEKFAANYRSLT